MSWMRTGQGNRCVAVASSCAALLIAAACSTDVSATGGSGGSIVVAMEQTTETFNPMHIELASASTYQIMQLVWPQATNFLPDGSYEWNLDLLTEEPTLETNPQRVTYHVHPDAVWSDGTPITADDFVFTWEVSSGVLGDEIDSETGERLPLYLSSGSVGYADQTCTAEGNKTVVCEYETPYADWYELFAPLLPRHAFEAQGDGDVVAGFNEGFPYGGTEPGEIPSGNWFRVAEVGGEETLTLARNEEFWGEPAQLDELVFRFIEDGAQQPAALQNGEVDLISPQAQLDLITQTEAIDGVEVQVGFGTFFEHIDFNVENPHLARSEVRRAIGLALDRRQIIDRVLGDLGADVRVMNHHFFYPGGVDYEPNGEELYGDVDLDEARAMLEQAGYAAGGGGTYEHPTDGPLSLRITWRAPNARREQTAQLVQAQLAEVGIDVALEPAQDFSGINAGDFDIALFGYATLVVPSLHASIYVTNGDSNVGFYSNPELDDMFAQANRELDPEARLELLHEIDEVLWEDLPVLPLYQVPELVAYDESVTNVEYNGYQGLTTTANRWALAG